MVTELSNAGAGLVQVQVQVLVDGWVQVQVDVEKGLKTAQNVIKLVST